MIEIRGQEGRPRLHVRKRCNDKIAPSLWPARQRMRQTGFLAPSRNVCRRNYRRTSEQNRNVEKRRQKAVEKPRQKASARTAIAVSKKVNKRRIPRTCCQRRSLRKTVFAPIFVTRLCKLFVLKLFVATLPATICIHFEAAPVLDGIRFVLRVPLPFSSRFS